jgi:outer membrane protein assembly factor BamB
VTFATYDRVVLLRLAITVAVAAALAGDVSAAEPSAKGPPPCREVGIISVRTGKVLRRLSARDGAYAGYAHGPLLPGEDAVSDGHDGWYAAGIGMGHLRSDGSLDNAWHSSLHAHLRPGTLARSGDRLFASDGRRVYAVEAATGRLLWSSTRVFGPNTPRIWSVAAARTIVYIGGEFTRVGSAKRTALAALDAVTGRLRPWQAPAPLQLYGRHAPGIVGKLALSGSRLYFIGNFSALGRHLVPRPKGVAAVRASDGRLTGFAPRGNFFAPMGLAIAEHLVLLGGEEGGGVFHSRTSRPVRGYAFDEVHAAVAITVHGSTAFLGGDSRTNFGGDFNLIAIDLHTAGFKRWFPKIAEYENVGTIAVSGSRAFVGGQFCND